MLLVSSQTVAKGRCDFIAILYLRRLARAAFVQDVQVEKQLLHPPIKQSSFIIIG